MRPDTPMIALAAITPELGWTTLGAMLGLAATKGWDFGAARVRDWRVWLRDRDEWNVLMDADAAGYRLEVDDMNSLEEISETGRGREPPRIVVRAYSMLTRKRRARRLQSFVDFRDAPPLPG